MVLTAEEKKKKRNYDRYWNHREEQLRKNKEWREKNREYLLQWKRDYNAGKKKISRVDRLKRERAGYQKNRERILERKRKRRMRPEVKAREHAYYIKHRDETRAKRLITKHKGKAKKTPFFESITPGYYKVGYTKNWVRRRQQYSGPAVIKQRLI